jgi:DNA-binding NtrC family response regulator
LLTGLVIIRKDVFNMNMNQKALIIDDQNEICHLLELILKIKNISSIHSGSLRETWDVLSAYHPDIIFIDHNLPDGLGFDHIPKIRQLVPSAKIIAMTAQISSLKKDEIIKKGASFFLEKPFTIQQVNKLVDY